MSIENRTTGTQEGTEKTVGLAFEPYPEIEEHGGFPDESGMYPSGKQYREIMNDQSDSDVDARPGLSQQELNEAHEVALAADKLETERARKIGAFASIGAAYTDGHLSSSVFDAAQQEISTTVAGLNKKLGTTYRTEERKVK